MQTSMQRALLEKLTAKDCPIPTSSPAPTSWGAMLTCRLEGSPR